MSEPSKVDENSKQSELPSEKEVRTCFRCETCNFRSETIGMGDRENTNNLTQQILNIEQIDGNVTPSSMMLESSLNEDTDLTKNDQSEKDNSETKREETNDNQNEEEETESENEEDESESEEEETESDESEAESDNFSKFLGTYNKLLSKVNRPLPINDLDLLEEGKLKKSLKKKIKGVRGREKAWIEIGDCVIARWEATKGSLIGDSEGEET